MDNRPVIAITMGDPAGIGPEIIGKLIESGEIHSLCTPLVVGDAGVIQKIIDELHLSISVHRISSPAEAAPRVARIPFRTRAGRRGTDGALELQLPVGARGSALGGSVASDVTGVEGIFWNPAGPSAWARVIGPDASDWFSADAAL